MQTWSISFGKCECPILKKYSPKKYLNKSVNWQRVSPINNVYCLLKEIILCIKSRKFVRSQTKRANKWKFAFFKIILVVLLLISILSLFSLSQYLCMRWLKGAENWPPDRQAKSCNVQSQRMIYSVTANREKSKWCKGLWDIRNVQFHFFVKWQQTNNEYKNISCLDLGIYTCWWV